jgi:hypothetical protein
VEYLQTCSNLTELKIGHCRYITNNGLSVLSHLKKLETLELNWLTIVNNNITSSALKAMLDICPNIVIKTDDMFFAMKERWDDIVILSNGRVSTINSLWQNKINLSTPSFYMYNTSASDYWGV